MSNLSGMLFQNILAHVELAEMHGFDKYMDPNKALSLALDSIHAIKRLATEGVEQCKNQSLIQKH